MSARMPGGQSESMSEYRPDTMQDKIPIEFHFVGSVEENNCTVKI